MKYGQYGLKQTYLREIEEDYNKEMEDTFDYIDNIKKRVYENLKLQRKDIQTLRNIITKNVDILENLEDIHSEKELLKLIISNNISKNIKGKNDEEVEEEDKYRQGKEHPHHALSPSRRAALAARRSSAGGSAGRNRRRCRSLIRQ